MADTTSNLLMLIGTAGEFPIHLIYGEKIDDPRPIILTVTLNMLRTKHRNRFRQIVANLRTVLTTMLKTSGRWLSTVVIGGKQAQY